MAFRLIFAMLLAYAVASICQPTFAQELDGNINRQPLASPIAAADGSGEDASTEGRNTPAEITVRPLRRPQFQDLSHLQWQFNAVSDNCRLCLDVEKVWLRFGRGSRTTGVLLVEPEVHDDLLETRGESQCINHPEITDCVEVHRVGQFIKDRKVIDRLRGLKRAALDITRNASGENSGGEKPNYHALKMLGIVASGAEQIGTGTNLGIKGIAPGLKYTISSWSLFDEDLFNLIPETATETRKIDVTIGTTQLPMPPENITQSEIIDSAKEEIGQIHTKRPATAASDLHATTTVPSIADQDALTTLAIARKDYLAILVGSTEGPNTKDPAGTVVSFAQDYGKVGDGAKKQIRVVKTLLRDVASSRSAFDDRRTRVSKNGEIIGDTSRGVLFVVAAGNTSKYKQPADSFTLGPINANEDLRDRLIIVGAAHNPKKKAHFKNRYRKSKLPFARKALYSNYHIKDSSSDDYERFVDIYAPSTSSTFKGTNDCNSRFYDFLRLKRRSPALQESVETVEGQIITLPETAKIQSDLTSLKSAMEDEFKALVAHDNPILTTDYSADSDCDIPSASYAMINGGTSAATTTIAAIAGMVHSINPELGAKEIKRILIDTGTPFTDRIKTGNNTFQRYSSKIVNPPKALHKAVDTVVLQWRDYWRDFFDHQIDALRNKEGQHLGFYSAKGFNKLIRSRSDALINCYSRTGTRIEPPRDESSYVQPVSSGIEEKCRSWATLDAYEERMVKLRNKYARVEISIFSDRDRFDAAKPVTRTSAENVVLANDSNFEGRELSVSFIQKFQAFDENEHSVYCDWSRKKIKFMLDRAQPTNSAGYRNRSFWWYVSREESETLDETLELCDR